ncbi:MFS transporter [Paraburkholderia sp. SARCC-3016]|jgi:AAHS family 4-hydroxybenzoate transporter-like MFS transporter|uniref:MFS transporter n=1 Tax=Paraburkholderia sp. SARCC-3016 TaxID=3058611 RepID=UPI002806EA9F|nr:MFS transporter [Paraburkholderia sp. SARCC-3016]MDQ7975984.1 MFS transporter [Paraburkholderia sp. SARCC-3016]
MAEPINVVEIIDSHKISWLQIRVAILGAITLMLDGFDNQMIGYVAPALKSAWHLSAGALGPVFSAGVFGVGLGSILIGPFGDRFGRVKTLLFTVLCFALISLLLAQATSITELTVLRFFIGLVLGAVIPLVVVLCNEYAPLRHRAKMVTMMTCGYAVGAASGGFLSVHIVPRFGWTSVFYVGAVLPLLLAVALMLWMPESIRFLTLRHDNVRIAAVLRKIVPSLSFPADAHFMMLTTGRDTGRNGTFSHVRELFTENRTRITLLLWTCLFMNLVVLNFMNNWLPTLVIQTGLPVPQALRTATMLQFGGFIGIALMGLFADRFGYYKVLAAVFALGCVGIASISQAGTSQAGLMVTIFMGGFAVIGSQMTLGALSATLYPTRIRATGSSWAFGVARLLSVVGPFVGGLMIARHWPLATIFYCAAAPMLFAMVAVLLMMRSRQPPSTRQDPHIQTSRSVS